MPADLDVGTQTDMEGTKQKVTQTDPDLSNLEVKIYFNKQTSIVQYILVTTMHGH